MNNFLVKFYFFILSLLLCSGIAFSQAIPTDFSDLHLWLKGDETMTLNDSLVQSWNDAGPGANNASQNNALYQPVFLNTDPSINNQPCVKFKDGDHILFPETNLIRTVFWVFDQDESSPNQNEPILGDDNTYNFHGDNDFLWRDGATSANVTNGTTRVNGAAINGKTTDIPLGFCQLSLITTGNVTASNFAIDRLVASKAWNGKLAELIIYTRALDMSEVVQIEDYLSEKYAPSINLVDTLYTNNLCDTIINIGKPWYESYQWSTSPTDTNSYITVSKSGWYAVTATSIFGKTSSDSLYVKFPISELPSEAYNCLDDSLILNLNVDENYYTIIWNSGDSAAQIAAQEEGIYFASITDTNTCTYTTDTLQLYIDSFKTQLNPLPTDTSFCSGNFVQANTNGYNITSYLWSTGSSNASIQIQNAATYALTLTNTNNCILQDSVMVNIEGFSPTVGFEVIKESCLNEPFIFIDTSYSNDASNIISWEWNFGDGASSNSQNPMHSYSDTGTYEVTLQITTDSACSSTYKDSLTTLPAPNASFTATNDPCTSYPVSFTNTSHLIDSVGASFFWSFGINNDTSTLQNPSYHYITEGNYQAQLIITNSYSCTDTFTQTISVTTECGEEYLPLELGGLHLWLKGSNDFNTTNDLVNIWEDASLNQNNAYQNNPSRQPLLLNSDTSINNQASVVFENVDFINFLISDSIRSVFWVLHEDKTVAANLAPLLGDSTTFNFHGGINTIWGSGAASTNITNGITRVNGIEVDGTTADLPDHYSIVSLKTTANVKASNFAVDRMNLTRTWHGKLAELIVFNKALEADEIEQIETYLSNKYAPPVNLPDTIYGSSFCDLTIEAHQPWYTSYVWNTSTADTTASITVNKNGWYAVSVTNIFGRASSDSVFIKFPVSDLNNNGKICLNDSAVLDLSPEITYQSINWNTGETSTSIVAVNPQQYYASIVDTFGCTYYTDTLTLTVDSFEIAIDPLPNDTSFCSGNVIEAYTGNFDINNYEWSNASTDSAIGIVTGGIYAITIENTSGCFNYDSIDVTIIGTAPQAQFSIPSFSCSNESVTFQDESFPVDQSNIVEWTWNFNDGDSSNLPSPTHLFDTAGSYQIQLTVITDSGCSKSITKNLAIFTAPMASFTISNNPLCNNTSISFTNTSTPQSGTLSSLKWKLGNTGDSAFTAFVERQFDAGTHQILLIAENSLSCKDTSSQTIEVHAAPTANFLFQGACANDSIQFIDNSNGLVSSWNWNFNNQATSHLANPKYPFSNSNQDYAVTLNTIDINSCEDDTTILVSPYPYPQASYGTINTICQNSVATLFSNSAISEGFILNNNWTFNLNGNPFVQNKDTISFSTENNQSISLQLISTSNRGCVDTLSTIVTVQEKPEALFTISSLYIEENATIDLENQSEETENQYWYFNDSLINTNTTFSYQVADSGTHQIQLITENTIGCTDTALKNIYVGPLRYDIAITKSDIILNENTNTYSIFAEIQNLTPIPVYDFQISASIYEGSSITEEWSSANPITLQEKILYEFNAKFELNNGNLLPENLCVEISNPNNGIDINALNDVSCIHNSETFQVKNLYPNPMYNIINVEVLSPTNNTLEIEIYNLYGSKIWNNNFDLSTGVNVLSVDVSNLKAAHYQIVFTTEENRISKYITKISPSE